MSESAPDTAAGTAGRAVPAPGAAADPAADEAATAATAAAATAEAAAVDPAVDPGLRLFTTEIADQVGSFVVTVEEVAAGEQPESAVSMLLLEVSQLLMAGGRLGAIADVVPPERYEPEMGPEPDDADQLRERLAELLHDLDLYNEVFDPYVMGAKPVPLRISDDLASVVADLRHGLLHYREGRELEALWWWQFSYFSSWGSTASMVLRALQSLVAHVRLDKPVEAAPEGADTDSVDDEALADEAGRVMAEELADLMDDGGAASTGGRAG